MNIKVRFLVYSLPLTFSAGKLQLAVDWYTKAVDLNVKHKNMAPVFSNRSQCHIKLESYGTAITDADKALENNPRFYKAYWRKGMAYHVLGELKKSLANYKKVSKLLRVLIYITRPRRSVERRIKK